METSNSDEEIPLIYVITLRSSPTRTATIRDMLASAGLKYRIIYGTDAGNPTELTGVPALPELARDHPGIVGCAWSHYRVAAEIAKSGKAGLVIEDDAFLTGSYSDVRKAVRDLPRSADLAFLHASSWDQAILHPDGHTKLFNRVSRVSHGTQFYYLAHKAAVKMLTEMLPVSDHIDRWYASRSHWNCYQIKQGLAIHNYLNGSVRNDSRIPKIFHSIWVGNNPMPESHQKWSKSWSDYNERNGYRCVLWTGQDLEQEFPELWLKYRGRNYSMLSDVFRSAILFKHGGIYVDTDFECLRTFHEIFDSYSSCNIFFGEESEGQCSSGLLAAVPNHPLIALYVKEIAEGIASGMPMPIGSGPHALKRALLKHYPKSYEKGGRMKVGSGEIFNDCFVFERRLVYPYPYGAVWRREDHPQALAVHHWAGSWL